MEHESLGEIQKKWHGTKNSYVYGFTLSLILTFASFSMVVMQSFFKGYALFFTLIGLALFQAVVQLHFFLHVGQEEKPRWETLIFVFMVLVLFIIVIGTLWIMFDLNNRVMSDMNM